MLQHPYSTYNPGFSGVIGVSQKDITPPLAIYSRSWGAGNYHAKIGVHHPLFLTCLVFSNEVGEKPLVIIGADLGWWNSTVDEWNFRSALLAAFNLDDARLMVCFSHTHSGPSLFMENQDKPGGDLIPAYLEYLKEQAIAAITEALDNAVPATLCWQYGQCDLAKSRDQPTTEKRKMLVGFNPDGEADKTLLVGRVANGRGEILATIINYACHPTTLAWDNVLLSPDYIGAMRQLIKEQVGGACLFLQGASGDLAPAEQYTGDAALADKYGRILGYAALAVLESMYPPEKQLCFADIVESGANLGVWKQRFRPFPSILRAEKVYVNMKLKGLPKLQEIEAEWRECEDAVKKERLWRLRGIRKNLGDGDESMMPLWVWRLGDACLIGQSNEAYSCYQQMLRKALSAYPVPVVVMNIVNGHMGYLPPEQLYDNDMYAVWQTPFAAGSLELLIRQSLATVEEMMLS